MADTATIWYVTNCLGLNASDLPFAEKTQRRRVLKVAPGSSFGSTRAGLVVGGKWVEVDLGACLLGKWDSPPNAGQVLVLDASKGGPVLQSYCMCI